MRNRSEFLLAAVSEAQGTIRALDVKLAALLVATLAPIALLGPLAECLSGVYLAWRGWFVGGVIVAFCVFWALALLCYSLALGAISSPAQHVKGSKKYAGSLYGPGIYALSLIDTLINRSNVCSKVDVATHLMAMPATQDNIDHEMAFEHLKLIYIRDIKLLRLRWAFRLSGSALLIGTVVYVIARYHLKECGP